MGSVISSTPRSSKRFWDGLSEHARLSDQALSNFVSVYGWHFCKWRAWLFFEDAALRQGVVQNISPVKCFTEYLIWLSLSQGFSVCSGYSVHTVHSGYRKACWHEKTGRCHHFVSPGATVGSGWHLQSCQRTSPSDLDLSLFVPLVSFSQKIISVWFFCFMLTLQKFWITVQILFKKKFSVVHISTIFCRCMTTGKLTFQKERDYISLKMFSFRDVQVAWFNCWETCICKLREWVEGEEYFPYKWISEVSSLGSLFLRFQSFWEVK